MASNEGKNDLCEEVKLEWSSRSFKGKECKEATVHNVSMGTRVRVASNREKTGEDNDLCMLYHVFDSVNSVKIFEEFPFIDDRIRKGCI